MAGTAKHSRGRRRRRLLAGIAALAFWAAIPLAAEATAKVFGYALEDDPESLDAAKAVSNRSLHVVRLLCDSLLNISRDGQSLEPGLAESWTLSTDGLEATVALRPGVSFHDGTPVDARAVKASFERQFVRSDPLYTGTPRNAKEEMLARLVEGIEVLGERHLKFKLKYPGIHYLSEVWVVSPDAVVKLGAAFGRTPVCSGPFKFESWLPDRITVAANDRYWGGRPRIDRVAFRFFPEAKDGVQALLSGDLDFIPVVSDPSLFERLSRPRVHRLPVSGLNVFYLGFYTERPPFSDPLLRRAVTRAINASRAAQLLGRGAAVPARGPLPPGMKGYDPSVSQAPYDPGAAIALLAKSRVPPGLTVGLVHNNAEAFYAQIAGAIQSDLGRVGIKVELLGKPGWDDVVKAARARAGDMYMWSWHVQAPYPERLLVPLFHSRSIGTSNLTHYSNGTVDGLLDEAAKLTEGPALLRVNSRIQRLIVDDAPMMFLYHAIRMAAYADRVKGLELNLASFPHDKLTRVDLTP